MMYELNQQFGRAGAVQFSQQDELALVTLTSAQASATIALQGAQLLDWQVKGQSQPLTFVSENAAYKNGKGVRGGAPVCWPWFGAKEGASAHGFVRSRLWTVGSTGVDMGSPWVCLHFSHTDETRGMWPQDFGLSLKIMLNEGLLMELTSVNKSDSEMQITEALHTYFRVGDVEQVRVKGLDGLRYLDKVKGFEAFTQSGDVSIAGEVDRVYLGSSRHVSIVDPVLSRVIGIDQWSANTTVVWNPGELGEKNFADMAVGEYRHMLCVESAVAGDEKITLAPGEKHTLRVAYSLSALH
jgi:glucose-6-phosphate 1-epimerase